MNDESSPAAGPAGTSDVAVIVLAAGAGTRMKSTRAKVLHEIGGRSLVGHALRSAEGLSPRQIVVVIGHDRDQVGPHVQEHAPEASLAVQEEQLGTGHAVAVGLTELRSTVRTVVVTYADVPLLEAQTLQALVDSHERGAQAVTVITSVLADPTGYGRIVRTPDGAVNAIVEQADADDAQREIHEVNSGIYAFDAGFLGAGLSRLGDQNAQGEVYLTDLVALARHDGHEVAVMATDDPWQTEGVNDRVALARLGAELNRRVLERWMRAGVTIVDPATTWIDSDVALGTDVTILPQTQIHGASTVGDAVVIGPDTTLTNVEIRDGATVVRTQAHLALIGEGATVGPFAYLRPGTELGTRGKIGTFVETKNAQIGDGSKVPHLTYVGDATIGAATNIGASSVFVNYDGVDKHHTTVGDHCRMGSDNMYVAPVTIGDGAASGAGAVIRQDVPPGALAVSAGRQRNIEGWVARKRPGSPAAQAAQAATATDPDLGHTDKDASASQEPS